MRNAAQLRAAARATGTYDDYVGDGASVPWLESGIVSLSLPVVLYAFKWYLDHNWPEAFKLHDWCYTPYGRLIDCTREEADSALYEEISADDATSAWIVYRAVRAGGGGYFGQSLTGYRGPVAQRSVDNIGYAPPYIPDP